MKHYVFWTPEADQVVQELLAREQDPTALVRILEEIERNLVWEPSEFGESRYDDIRVAFVDPIGIQRSSIGSGHRHRA